MSRKQSPLLACDHRFLGGADRHRPPDQHAACLGPVWSSWARRSAPRRKQANAREPVVMFRASPALPYRRPWPHIDRSGTLEQRGNVTGSADQLGGPGGNRRAADGLEVTFACNLTSVRLPMGSQTLAAVRGSWVGPAPGSLLAALGSGLLYRVRDVTEWYRPRALGLEHRFIVGARPSAAHGALRLTRGEVEDQEAGHAGALPRRSCGCSAARTCARLCWRSAPNETDRQTRRGVTVSTYGGWNSPRLLAGSEERTATTGGP